MSADQDRWYDHKITINAPAERVYARIADVSTWALTFPDVVHAERVAGDDTSERIALWVHRDDRQHSWTSRRLLDAAAMRVEFHKETAPSQPGASLGGVWRVRPNSAEQSELCLSLKTPPREPASTPAELIALSEALRHTAQPLEISDSVVISGDVDAAYAFIYEAAEWADRLPHVASVSLREDSPNVQLLSMTTTAPDGTEHDTTSVRVCFPIDRIVYKQLHTPRLLREHLGRWEFRSTDTGVSVVSHHTVLIDESAIEPVLGEGATPAQAEAFVRRALGANSRATLARAKEHVESARNGRKPDAADSSVRA